MLTKSCVNYSKTETVYKMFVFTHEVLTFLETICSHLPVFTQEKLTENCVNCSKTETVYTNVCVHT